MIKTLKVCLLSLLLLLPGLALAEAKIAVLNPQVAIINTDEAQKKLEELRNEPTFAANLKELESLQKQYKDLTDQFQKDNAVMGDEEKQSRVKVIQEKQQDIEYLARKLQASEQGILQQLVEEMRPKFTQAVGDLIKGEGIDLLLDRKSVLHVESAYSITSKVTDKMNQIK